MGFQVQSHDAGWTPPLKHREEVLGWEERRMNVWSVPPLPSNRARGVRDDCLPGTRSESVRTKLRLSVNQRPSRSYDCQYIDFPTTPNCSQRTEHRTLKSHLCSLRLCDLNLKHQRRINTGTCTAPHSYPDAGVGVEGWDGMVWAQPRWFFLGVGVQVGEFKLEVKWELGLGWPEKSEKLV